ncbi:hypothetical protein B0H11DRAFT_1816359, partial [Mycena galericulata]
MDLVAPAAAASHPTSADEPLPICVRCHKAPVTSRNYTSCRPCRDKRAAQSRRSKERKRERAKMQMLVLQAGTTANIPVVPSEESSSVGAKRKAPADTGSEDVMERMRKRFKKMEPFVKADATLKVTPPDRAADPVFEKFAVNKDLYKEIRGRYPDNSSSLRFYGTYAIIAVPDIDNKKRTRVVARDLKENTNLHFRCDKKSTRGSDDAHTYTIAFKCTCRATSTIKRSASDLSIYFGSKKTPAASDETPKNECRGRIEISAADDRSHPLGWLGQRVKVTVTH